MINYLKTNASDEDKRLYLSLMHAYCRELAKINKEDPAGEIELDIMYINFLNTSNISCCKLMCDDKFVGFILFEDVRNDIAIPFDFFIIETYIVPEYRKKGIVSSVFKEFVLKNNIKRIGYVVLENNNNADIYWKKRFSEIGFIVSRNDTVFPSKFRESKCYIAKLTKR